MRLAEVDWSSRRLPDELMRAYHELRARYRSYFDANVKLNVQVTAWLRYAGKVLAEQYPDLEVRDLAEALLRAAPGILEAKDKKEFLEKLLQHLPRAGYRVEVPPVSAGLDEQLRYLSREVRELREEVTRLEDRLKKVEELLAKLLEQRGLDVGTLRWERYCQFMSRYWSRPEWQREPPRRYNKATGEVYE